MFLMLLGCAKICSFFPSFYGFWNFTSWASDRSSNNFLLNFTHLVQVFQWVLFYFALNRILRRSSYFIFLLMLSSLANNFSSQNSAVSGCGSINPHMLNSEAHHSAMNHCVPDWSMEDDPRSLHGFSPSADHMKPIWPEDDLVELLWQNGHVVMHSQTHRKTMTPLSETKQCKPEPALKGGGSSKNSATTVQEETAPWHQYSIDEEFCPELFYELPTTESIATDKVKEIGAEGNKFTKHETPERSGIFSELGFEQSTLPQFAANVMSPQSELVASLPQTTSVDSDGYRNFTNFSRPLQSDSTPLNGHLGEKTVGNLIQEVGESSSMMTKESSICGSNQIHNWFGLRGSNTVKTASAEGLKEDAPTTRLGRERAHTDTHETTITSSSGGSGWTIGRTGQQSASARTHKRKRRDADESEFQSEEAGYESMDTNRQSQGSASARRRRAAEVHNLSERKRRDRINEKMKALQELIPHCNKSDKASMLDEAIEYLKSLQLQVQMMWMRGGMAPMMFPGVHHYMSQMGMGMGHTSMPSIHGPIQFPRVPLVNQPVPSNPTINQAPFCPSTDISPVNFQNRMQNVHIPASYARYVGFQNMQPSPQMMNFYAYGAQFMQQSQAALAARSSAPCVGEAPSENAQKVVQDKAKR